MAEVGTGLVEHPLPERDDQARLLGEGDELGGRHQPPHRVLPTHQGLEPGDGPVGQPHDGLVVETELAGPDGVLERRPALEAGQCRLLERGLEESEGALAGVLGRVQGQVGLAQQVGSGVGVVVGRRDADAQPGDELDAVQPEGLPEGVEDAGGQRRQVELGGGGELGADGELVAAQAGGRILLAEAARQAGTHLDEQLVTGGMSELLVDRTEVVEVDDHHLHRSAGAPLPPRGPVQVLGEQRPVGQ